jgi:hypothetical protein
MRAYNPSDARLTRPVAIADVFNTQPTKPIQHQAQRRHSPLIGEERDAGVVPPTSAEKVTNQQFSPTVSDRDRISVVPEQREPSLRSCLGLFVSSESR